MDKSLPLVRCREKDPLTARDRRYELVRTAAAEFCQDRIARHHDADARQSCWYFTTVLYMHFASKECLFREAVQWNSNARTHAVQRRIGSIAAREIPDWLEQAVEAVVTVCLSAEGGPMLMNRALLESPEFGADLQWQEMRCVAAIWEQEISLRIQHDQPRQLLSTSEIYCAVQTCYSYALWLGALRHTHASAAALVRRVLERAATCC